MLSIPSSSSRLEVGPKVARRPTGLENFPEPTELVTVAAGVKAECRASRVVAAVGYGLLAVCLDEAFDKRIDVARLG
jgi:hypothetical protein